MAADAFMLSPRYRSFELPWSVDPAQERRFRRLWVGLLVAGIVLGIVVWLMPVPESTATLKPAVPLICATSVPSYTLVAALRPVTVRGRGVIWPAPEALVGSV